MRSRLAFGVFMLLLVAPAAAQNEIKYYGPNLMRDQAPKVTPAPPHVPSHLKYGSKYWNFIDFYDVPGAKAVPLVVVLTDGSWPSRARPYPLDWMPYRLGQQGYAVALISYVGKQDEDPQQSTKHAVAAIAWLRKHATELRIDPDRLAVLGYGGGARFAVLLGTDERYWNEVQVPFGSVRGIIAVNGDGFDIPRRMLDGGVSSERYQRVFGKDPERQIRLSPTAHLAAPNAPTFLLMTAEDDREILPQSRAMAEALSNAGIEARFVPLPRWSESWLPSYFLAVEDGSGKAALDFLKTSLQAP